MITADSDAGRAVLRHSTAHVLAQAVLRLWPGAHYAIGPVIEDGFYYDFELPGGAHFSDDDLGGIEATMREIMAEDQPFIRHEHTIDEGLSLFEDQPFKREIIEAVGAGHDEVDATAGEVAAGPVSTYWNSPTFTDLCLGPHVPSTSRLGHFALMRVAGAYWRGDEKRQQLQRIYGTAWESDKALAAHLHRLEEAERRDHRKLGAELDLFSFPEEIGSGLAVFHPKGGIVRRLMEEYSRQRHEAAGYEFVYTPHITKAELFETSGHLDWFAEGMFPPMELDGGHQYYLKPMNCPFHILIFKSRQRSYREFPIRLFEFGSVYRYEKSGVVHGLTRVRGMTQDDAHIFCTREQMAASSTPRWPSCSRSCATSGSRTSTSSCPPGPRAKRSDPSRSGTRPPKRCRSAAAGMDLDLVLDEGGGAFYGPKISVQARDAIGRTHQMSTIQLDFQEPQRFDMEYIGADNGRHRPIMIHRALFGSVERFFAILLEHYAGALPTWLSPEQVRVLGVRDDHEEYAHKVADRLRAIGARVSVDPADEPLKPRVGKAKVLKIPYILVVGDDDVRSGTVGVNRRGGDRPERGVELAAFTEMLEREIARAPPPRTVVTLDTLWAGWRSDYVTSVTSAHAADPSSAAPLPATIRNTVSSAASPPAAPPRRTTACSGVAAAPTSCSTPIPMPAGI